MSKFEYEAPTMDVLELLGEDVICTSSVDPDNPFDFGDMQSLNLGL